MRKIYGVKTATYHESAALFCESYADAYRMRETINELQIKSNQHEPQDFITAQWLLPKEVRDDK